MFATFTVFKKLLTHLGGNLDSSEEKTYTNGKYSITRNDKRDSLEVNTINNNLLKEQGNDCRVANATDLVPYSTVT